MTSTRIFVLMLAILAVAALLVQAINLPGIVGAFLAGLSVNAAVHDKPAREKLEFFGNSFFIPIFFIVTGFLVDPVVFFHSGTNNFAHVQIVCCDWGRFTRWQGVLTFADPERAVA